MSAYFVLTHTITDPQKYMGQYVPAVMPFLAKYKADVVAAELDAKPLEGSPAKGVVVLRFPSEQAIQDFLADPDYQPVKQIRMGITVNGNAWILGGIVARGKTKIKVNGGMTVLYSGDAITQMLQKYGSQFVTLSWREK